MDIPFNSGTFKQAGSSPLSGHKTKINDAEGRGFFNKNMLLTH